MTPNRQRFLQLLGGVPRDAVPLEPRWEDLPEHKGITSRRVWIPVDEGVHVYGVLLVPAQPTGPKPAVIAQHGFSGSPEATCGYYELEETAYLRSFGLRLAEKGYVVFAPLVMNNTPDRSRTNRKAVLHFPAALGAGSGQDDARGGLPTDTLPEVDNRPHRLHGHFAGRHDGALGSRPADERIAACVCSGYFHQPRAEDDRAVPTL